VLFGIWELVPDALPEQAEMHGPHGSKPVELSGQHSFYKRRIFEIREIVVYCCF
jgi:hypothetical protein